MRLAATTTVAVLAAAASSVDAFTTRPLAKSHRPQPSTSMRSFTSAIFPTKEIALADTKETVVEGGRDLFPLLRYAFAGVRSIGVIGWGPQASEQAQKLEGSLRDAGLIDSITIRVGLRTGSLSFEHASAAGFSTQNGTLGEMFDVIRQSDLVMLLISDAAQAKLYNEIFAAMKPGATLGLSNGFLLGHLDSLGEHFPADMDVIAVCPHGIRRPIYPCRHPDKELLNRGARINSSFAVHQDTSGTATELALGWGIALGSAFLFETSLRSQYCCNMLGDRGIVLGAVFGIIQSLFRRFQRESMSPEEAFRQSSESITGNIDNLISKKGIRAVYDSLGDEGKETFERVYSASYKPAKEILQEIYDEVSSGNEIRSVIMHDSRLDNYPLRRIIDGTTTSQVGQEDRYPRATRDEGNISYNQYITDVYVATMMEDRFPLNPVTAGVYVATMMAHIDVLLEEGHPYSEVINKSVIEAVDSRCLYMHERGLASLVDNCSFTAKTGICKWAPRFEYILEQQAYTAIENESKMDNSLICDFLAHSVHGAVAQCCKLRPPMNTHFD